MSNVLQEQVSQQKEQGTFQSQGSKDILSEAIGKPDHKGRVLGVGGGTPRGLTSRTPPTLQVPDEGGLKSVRRL